MGYFCLKFLFVRKQQQLIHGLFYYSQIILTNICPNRNDNEPKILDSIFAIWSPNVKAT
jgi:hypothetical protein